MAETLTSWDLITIQGLGRSVVTTVGKTSMKLPTLLAQPLPAQAGSIARYRLWKQAAARMLGAEGRTNRQGTFRALRALLTHCAADLDENC